jgi:nitroimidazol reductase NimA-like FMN-containing flavoprotein (pyridoxamine 5'-phosphate oxidase superfamily)
MLADIKTKILDLLAQHRIMTVATVRPDGWPQATTVGFVSDGLTLYFLCSRDSQKAANLSSDNRVSLTIGGDTPNPMAIEGLSMAARAYPVSSPAERAKALGLMPAKYPEYSKLPPPDLAAVAVYRVVPVVISVLDYSKGFGHSDLVEVSPAELAA